jgi:hypothetical protein
MNRLCSKPATDVRYGIQRDGARNADDKDREQTTAARLLG